MLNMKLKLSGTFTQLKLRPTSITSSKKVKEKNIYILETIALMSALDQITAAPTSIRVYFYIFKIFLQYLYILYFCIYTTKCIQQQINIWTTSTYPHDTTTMTEPTKTRVKIPNMCYIKWCIQATYLASNIPCYVIVVHGRLSPMWYYTPYNNLRKHYYHQDQSSNHAILLRQQQVFG